MSEIVSTVLKILTALTSPKVSIKFLCVAITLFFCWWKLEPLLSQIVSIPSEYKNVILLLAGVSVGSLFGGAIATLFGFFSKKYQTKKTKDLEEKEKIVQEELRIQEQVKLFKKFKTAFPYFTYEQKQLVRKLSKKNIKVSLANTQNETLYSNGYIQVVSKINGNDYLVRLNHVIKDYVTSSWEAEVKCNIDDFLGNKLFDGGAILEAMKEKSELLALNSSSLDLLYKLKSSVLECNVNDDDEDDGYWIWFKDDILEVLEPMLGDKFREELFIPTVKLIN